MYGEYLGLIFALSCILKFLRLRECLPDFRHVNVFWTSPSQFLASDFPECLRKATRSRSQEHIIEPTPLQSALVLSQVIY